VDVNEYWALEEALEAIPQLAALGVEYVEQPLPAGDDDAETLKDRSELPIFVDEDCHTLADVARCARIAHGINVKLAKSGGIREAVRMAHAARALDLDVMLGCMVESGLAIAAAAQIASLFDHVDLDGNLLLAEDPWPGVELRDGVQLPSDAPGLGVRPQVPDPR
jgi:L-alanine-DL-glutamate epimerase-like enolase superfamily enzyme